MSTLTFPWPATDQDRLFCALALRFDFIGGDALDAVMNVCRTDPTKRPGELLVDRGQLTPERARLLDALVREYLRAHEDDIQQSLDALWKAPTAAQMFLGLTAADVQLNPRGITLVGTGDVRRTEPDGNRHQGESAACPRYHVLRPHAKGGLGEVFVAEDRELHREVALKEIPPSRAPDPDLQRRFLLEAEITGRLEHPGVVPVYGMGSHADGRPFYAMRLIRGETLKEAIRRFHGTATADASPWQRGFALRQLLGRFIAVCNTVAYAHSRGVVHRDLKPGNIMLGRYGETWVIDWGLAKPASSVDPARFEDRDAGPLRPSSAGDTGTQAGALLGTPAYMSPEQAAGRWEVLGPASDIYALGATLYSLLTGQAPVTGRDGAEVVRKAREGDWVPPRRIDPTLPEALDAICCKAMAFDPAGRYRTALELAADIELWLAGATPAAGHIPWPIKWRLGHRSRTWGAVLVAAVILALAILATLLAIQWIASGVASRPANFSSPQEGAASGRPGEVRGQEAGEQPAAAGQPRREESTDVSLVLELAPKVMDIGGHAGAVTSTCFSPDGKRLAGAGANGTVRVWDLAARREDRALRGHAGAVNGVCFSPDGRRLASAGADGAVRVWDAQTGQEQVLLRGHAGAVNGVCFSPDGRRLASAGADGAVRVWDAQTGEELLSLRGPEGRVHAVAYSPDGRRLASAGADGAVRVWDAQTGRAALTLLGHVGAATSVCFSPDGRRLASAGEDGAVRVWDAQTGQEQVLLRGHGSPVTAVCFSPDGKRLASGSKDETVRVRDVQTWHEVLVVPGGPGVCFSPDGNLVATVVEKGRTVGLWNLVTKR
jgi:WD40 repeat protein/serine/threonine protein kinase